MAISPSAVKSDYLTLNDIEGYLSILNIVDLLWRIDLIYCGASYGSTRSRFDKTPRSSGENVELYRAEFSIVSR